MALGVHGCVMPEEIRERPVEEDGDGETAYRPLIMNPQPPAIGMVSIPAACKEATFKFLLSEIPDPADPRYAGFEVRWFLDYAENNQPYATGGAAEEQSVTINPSELYDPAVFSEPGNALHYLEVLVSDVGFEKDSDLPPRFRRPLPEARTAQLGWFIRLDPDVEVSNQDEQCP